MERIIAHLDMDAFYANAELVRNPALKGLPVVVGGRSKIQPLPGQPFPVLAQYEGRGVLTTANYEARKLGLHSAMPTMKAAKLAPHAILLPADFEWYKTQSRAFKDAVRKIAPHLEDRGIDEIYLDLTEQTAGNFDQAQQLAFALQAAVFTATGGMTCSIGLSQNKLTSKICSDLNKPNGVTLVPPDQFKTVIWPLPVGKINGIGPKAVQKLNALGIFSIEDLARTPPETLQMHFGQSYGFWMHQSAHGIDPREVTLFSEPKSVSRETTFEHDMHVRRHREQLSEVLIHLVNRLAADLSRKKKAAKTIGIKVRFADFKSLTRDITDGTLHWQAETLLQAARACLRKTPFANTGAQANIRLLGLRASQLVDIDEATKSPVFKAARAEQTAQLDLWGEDGP
ncbi:DNA polymerase IV [Limnobacter sp.]|uniref:DNA polymerase IV n=1 Tax=Limnobacter sp. TaxID=2003368 RepID=UPI0035162C39